MQIRRERSALDEMSGAIEPSFAVPTTLLLSRVEPASAAQASARLTPPIATPDFAPVLVSRPPALFTMPTPPAAFERPVLPPTASRFTDVLGLAFAWIVTAGAGAVIAGHMMARSQPPLIVRVPFATAAMVAPSAPPAAPSCPKSWEPPLVAVTDLPVAPRASAPHAAFITASAPLSPPTEDPAAQPVPVKTWASLKRVSTPAANASALMKRRAHASEPWRQSAATKGKTAPKSLADWMQAEVDSK